MVTRQQFHSNTTGGGDPFSPRPRKPRRMRRGTRNRIIALILLVILLGGGVYGGTKVYQWIQNTFLVDHYQAFKPNDKSKQVITIPSGATTADMGNLLADKGIIADGKYFYQYAVEKGINNLQAGDYELSPSQNMQSIMTTMKAGPDANLKKRAFIKKMVPTAQAMSKKYGVLASIDIAQAILESEWGQSTLASKYNNYFGIKAQGDQKSVTLSTQEYNDAGQWVTEKAAFAVYDNWATGMEAHAQFLKDGTDLKPNVFADVIAATNYKEAAAALVADGYATDPTYEAKIIEVIETWDLAQYDK